MDKLSLEVNKTEDAGNGEVFVTYTVEFNGNSKRFLKRVSNYIGCMPLVLLKDEKVNTFLEFQQ